MLFEGFPKIGRLSRGCTITEKIDGSNAQIGIWRESADTNGGDGTYGALAFAPADADGTRLVMAAGSRSRWLDTSSKGDNFGFAKWVAAHATELFALGEGRHFGEWWGSGIQRRYGLEGDDKRFSLFNVDRWGDGRQPRPACCGVVPVLHNGQFTDEAINNALEHLRVFGSVAATGFRNPEGVVVYHHATKTLFKKMVIGDENSKGE